MPRDEEERRGSISAKAKNGADSCPLKPDFSRSSRMQNKEREREREREREIPLETREKRGRIDQKKVTSLFFLPFSLSPISSLPLPLPLSLNTTPTPVPQHDVLLLKRLLIPLEKDLERPDESQPKAGKGLQGRHGL
jgi:hypothetical protein